MLFPFSSSEATTTSQLKISQLNQYTGACTGKTEIYMLCDKVQKGTAGRVIRSPKNRLNHHDDSLFTACRRRRDHLPARLVEGQRRVCPDGRPPADRDRVQNASLPGPGHHRGSGRQRQPAPALRPDGERAGHLHVPAVQSRSATTVTPK